MEKVQPDGRRERRNQGRLRAIEAAAQMFSKGDLILTMSHLADRTGISERTLFRYFDSQDKLIESVADFLIPQIARFFSNQPIEGNLEQRIRGLIALRLEYVQGYSAMIRTLETHSPRFKEASEIRRGRDILLNDQFSAWLGDDANTIPTETYHIVQRLIDLRNLDALHSEIGENTLTVVGDAVLLLLNSPE